MYLLQPKCISNYRVHEALEVFLFLCSLPFLNIKFIEAITIAQTYMDINKFYELT